MFRSVVVAALVVTALVVAACSGAESSDVDIAALEKNGPYAIGFRIEDVRYTPPLAAEPRTVTTFVWYPAEAATGERPIYTLKSSEVAVTDAPPLDLGPRPVVVFSHGSQAYAAAMSHWMEHLASHGFIVIAPTHAGNTFIDGDDRMTDIYYQRPLDVRAAVDHVAGLKNDPLSGMLSDRMAITGHSFGAYTAFLLAGAKHAVDELEPECTAGTASTGYCSKLDDDNRALFRAGFEDDRFDVVVSIDPGDFNLLKRTGLAEVDVPVLHMVAESSGHTPGDPSGDNYWTALTNPADTRMLLLGGDHNDFVDACDLDFDIRCSDLQPKRVWRATRALALAFLRARLVGEGGYAGILDGTTVVSDLAEVRGR